MFSKKGFVRIILFILITIAFSTTFYFFFKNSRAAGSPLKDKEYMEQLTTLSERYDIVSPIMPTPTPQIMENKENQNILTTISISVLDFISNLLK